MSHPQSIPIFPSVGEFLLSAVLNHRNGKAQALGRLLRGLGYQPNDLFTSRCLRYLVNFVDETSTGLYSMSRIRIDPQWRPADHRPGSPPPDRYLDWVRYYDGRQEAPWRYASIPPRQAAIPWIPPDTRQNMNFCFDLI